MAELDSGPRNDPGGQTAASEAKKGVLARMAGVFVEPQATFEEISNSAAEPHPTEPGKTANRSKWWVPFLVSVVISALTVAITYPMVIAPMQAEAIRASVLERGGTVEQAEQIIDQMGSVGMPLAVVGAALVMAIFFFITVALIHLLMRMMGGKGKFAHGLSVAAYAGLISALGAIVKLPIMISQKTMQVELGPTLLMPGLEPSDRLFRFLMSFDVFMIWWAVVMIVGMAVGYRVSRGKSAISVVTVWVLLALLALLAPTGG